MRLCVDGLQGGELLKGDCELRVRSVGLDFRDVLNVMGLYPGNIGVASL